MVCSNIHHLFFFSIQMGVMMDESIDKSVELNQFQVDMAVKYNRVEVPDIKPNGTCHYCEAPVDKPKLYCSNICADAHDKML